MAEVSEQDEDSVVAAVCMLNWTICNAAHSEMYRRSSVTKSTIVAKALSEMMVCGSNVTFDTSGIVTVVNLEQLAKALLPMDVTPSGMVIDVNPAHLAKALSPMDVTLSGMVMDVNLAHLKKVR